MTGNASRTAPSYIIRQELQWSYRSIVRVKHNESIIQFPIGFEKVQDFTNVVIHAFDHGRVDFHGLCTVLALVLCHLFPFFAADNWMRLNSLFQESKLDLRSQSSLAQGRWTIVVLALIFLYDLWWSLERPMWCSERKVREEGFIFRRFRDKLNKFISISV
jgi:hypothetical protein